MAVPGALTRADTDRLSAPSQFSLVPSPPVIFHSQPSGHGDHKPQRTESAEARVVTCIFQFSLAGSCSWGCSGQTPGSLDFPVWEVHGDFESCEDLAEAGQRPPVGWCESEGRVGILNLVLLYKGAKCLPL